jgi:hypothetical protein
MNYTDVKDYAKNLIEYTGSDPRVNALENPVKAVLLNSHLWERFYREMDFTYVAGAEGYDLDSATATKPIYKILGLRFPSGTFLGPPDYITPDEYNRLAVNWASASDPVNWTMIGRELRLLGVPAGNLVITAIYSRDPANVNWGEIPSDFLDYAGTILARMLTPIKSVAANGYPVANPVYTNLVALEQGAFRKMVGIEYRQPARKYEVQQDEMRTIRYEQYDY